MKAPAIGYSSFRGAEIAATRHVRACVRGSDSKTFRSLAHARHSHVVGVHLIVTTFGFEPDFRTLSLENLEMTAISPLLKDSNTGSSVHFDRGTRCRQFAGFSTDAKRRHVIARHVGTQEHFAAP